MSTLRSPSSSSDVPARSIPGPERSANAFDLIRLVLAVAVVFSHSWLLGGFGDPPYAAWMKHQVSIGGIAVFGFLGISGYFAASGIVRARSAFAYLLRRATRILPAYWLCLCIVGFLLAPALFRTRHGTLDGFRWGLDDGALGFVVHNALLKINQWSISGVLDGAPYDASLNGSLWLLGGILLCYVVAAALAALRGHGECRQLLAALTLGALLFHVLHATNRATSYPELPSFTVLSPFFRYGTAFLVGMCLRVWPTLAASGRPAVVAYAAVFVVLLKFGGFVLVAPVLIPALVITLGNAFVAPLPVDLSFGIFIYAFPVQQLMAALPIVSKSFTGFFLAALVLATALAASAHFLLERTLRRPAHARPL